MATKLKTFEDIWKSKLEEKRRNHDEHEEEDIKIKNQQKNDKVQNKIHDSIINLNNNNSNQNTRNKIQNDERDATQKKNGLLNERDWEYLDKLGEKFKILEEKSSNYQKNFKNTVNKIKNNVENDEQSKNENENNSQKMNRISPQKNNQNKMLKKEGNQYTKSLQNFQSNNIQQQSYDSNQSNHNQFNSFKQQNKSTSQISIHPENINSFEEVSLKKNIMQNNFMINEYEDEDQDENQDEINAKSFQLNEKSNYECTFQPNNQRKTGLNSSQNSIMQKQINRDYPANHLYDDAKLRQQKQQVIEKLVIKEQKKQTNQSKIDVNSQKIILKKIEEFLQAIVASIELDEDFDQFQSYGAHQNNGQNFRKILKFEGVGYFFQQLGILRAVKFQENENGDISISQLRDMNNIEIDRMKAEMTFHEELWKIMSIDQQQYKAPEEIENIPSKLLFDISMVLLELKLTASQSELLLNEILIANLFGDDPSSGQKAIDAYFQIPQNWNLEFLVKQFRLLFDDKTTLMDIYVNWNKRISNGISNLNHENSEMSFHPQINQRSRVMDSMIQQSKSSINQKRHETLFEHHKIKNEKQQQYKVEKLQKEIEECTFKPQTNSSNNRKNNKDTRNKNSVHNNFDGIKEAEDEENYNDEQKRYEQLFKIHNRKQNQIKEIKEYVEFYRQEQELEQCTFKPQTYEVNKEILNEGHIQNVKGLNQQLQRMYKARKNKLEKEMFYEKQRHTLTVQNQKQGSKVQPFSFEQREKQKKIQTNEQKKLLGHIDINITKNKKGKVTLHEGDSAIELANTFAKIHNIAPEMTETLADMLQQYLDKYASQKQQ